MKSQSKIATKKMLTTLHCRVSAVYLTIVWPTSHHSSLSLPSIKRKTVLHTSSTSVGKDQTSKFEVWYLLNVHHFCTIIRSKIRKSRITSIKWTFKHELFCLNHPSLLLCYLIFLTYKYIANSGYFWGANFGNGDSFVILFKFPYFLTLCLKNFPLLLFPDKRRPCILY